MLVFPAVTKEEEEEVTVPAVSKAKQASSKLRDSGDKHPAQVINNINFFVFFISGKYLDACTLTTQLLYDIFVILIVVNR